MPEITNQELIKSVTSLTCKEWADNVETWQTNTIRFNASVAVYDELAPFQWETNQDQTYRDRKARAVYPDLPGQTAERFVGVMMEEPPEPTWNTLGKRTMTPGANETRVDMIWNNADGVGDDARSWHSFWADQMQQAMPTKFRWILAEQSRITENTLTAEARGQRPYFVGISPIETPFYRFEKGELKAFRREIKETVYEVDDSGKVVQKERTIHYVMVCKGWKGFGEEFGAGGWWMFTDKDEPLKDENGESMWDDLEETGGAIPITRIFYERSGSTVTDRGGILNLGRISIAFMDVLSWMWHDAKISGGRKRYFLGVDRNQWDTIANAEVGGGIDVPVPAGATGNVTIYDTGQTSANEHLSELLDKLLTMAIQIIMRELMTSPDASGRSRIVAFLQSNSPRLAHMAGNMEEAQNAALAFLYMRWGVQPDGYVEWERRYDMRTMIQRVAELFQVFEGARASSATLFQKVLTDLIIYEGHMQGLKEPEIDQVKSEILASLQVSAQSGNVPSAFGISDALGGTSLIGI